MYVLDCSVMSAWLLPDEQSNTDILQSFLIEKTPSIYVPCIFYIEVMNVLLTAFKRNRIDENTKNQALEVLKILPIQVDNAGLTPEFLSNIALFAQRYQLTSYDASYLELAVRHKFSLITLDKALIQAAKVENCIYFL